MASLRPEGTPHRRWWALALMVVLGLLIYASMSLFAGSFRSYVPLTLTSDRAGLVMDPGAKVKMRGVPVGRVATITGGATPVSLTLEIFPEQVRYIPANIQARIRATTAFGAKFVDLIYPTDPSPQRIAAGQVITSQNVSTEVNTVFQNLTDVLERVDPAKLNGILTAVSEGLRGEGPAIGQATTDANQVLLAVNPRAESLRNGWRSLRGFSDTYSAAASNVLSVLDSASTTSTTIAGHASDLDSLLLNVTGFAHSGIDLVGPSKDNFVNGINALEPTTQLLEKYSPELTCTLQAGAKYVKDDGFATAGGNGRTLIIDAALLLGDDIYRFPDNLPVVAAKGGPGGKPGCGSLPNVAKNWPLRQLVTNTGWGTGLDWRPNPGIGFPGYVDYFPTTRAVPKDPSIRYPGGPAPGPIPYPGAPPYGAPMYAPDGTPLWPGLPPAPPSGTP